MASAEEAVVYAVASRSEDRAQDFAQRHGIEKAYGSYEDMVEDRNVDVIYVATLAPRHHADCLLCLEAGKPVLCEKPFTCNAAEARDVVATARRKSLFCMEAMWMRFNPLVQEARNLVLNGDLGDVQFMRAEIGSRQRQDAGNRLLNAELGGGACLDLAIYPVSLAYFLFGPPDKVVAQATMHPWGVDETTSAILSYPTLLVALSASVGTTMSNEAAIHGTKRRAHLLSPFINPTLMRLSEVVEVQLACSADRSSTRQKIIAALPYRHVLRRSYQRLRTSVVGFSTHGLRGTVRRAPAGADGFRMEAEEAMRCIRAGRGESAVMPLDESIQVMEAMDRLRASKDAI